MKKILTKIEWIFDYYFAWMTYNGYKLHKYHKYMVNKWGERYTKKFKKYE